MMLLFLAGNIWQYLKSHPAKQPQKAADTVTVKLRSKLELKLQAAIDGVNGHVLVLVDTAYPTPISISKAITINKDSLLIKAKGKIIIQSNSGYTGAAFSLAPACKNIMLDSLSIHNFKTGVTQFNNVLGLKNVQFINCAAPVQSIFTIPTVKNSSAAGRRCLKPTRYL
jgi:hypothetical protein